MNRPHEKELERLRRSPWAVWLAAVLLLFQVVLAADHLGASAAAAFGTNQSDETPGLLSLCRGDGSVSLAEGDGTPPASGTPVPPCVLCASISLTGTVLEAAAPILPPPPPPIPPRVFASLEAVATPPVLRYGTGRGPPVVPVV